MIVAWYDRKIYLFNYIFLDFMISLRFELGFN